MNWSSLCVLAFVVVGSSAFLFPGGGGGGGGCGGGCGGQDTSCIPKLPTLACQRICFSIPTLRLPSPCGGGGGGCGCGRKKREVSGDGKCSDPELKTIIAEALRNTPQESRDNIVAGLKQKFVGIRYLVTCVAGKNDFKTSAEHFCVEGTEQQTCLVVKAVEQV